MEEILKNIQTRITEIVEIKYVDEDWGQLDLFGTDIPVQFPCVVFDIKTGSFGNLGNDRKQVPQQRQIGKFVLELSVATLKLSNTSVKAPISQKNNAWKIYDLIKSIHEKLQGFSANENCGKLNRVSYQKIRRDDGVQEFRLIYDFEVGNF